MDEWMSEWTNERYWAQDQQVKFQVGYFVQLVWSALVELNAYSQGCSVSLGPGDPEVEKLL